MRFLASTNYFAPINLPGIKQGLAIGPEHIPERLARFGPGCNPGCGPAPKDYALLSGLDIVEDKELVILTRRPVKFVGNTQIELLFHMKIHGAFVNQFIRLLELLGARGRIGALRPSATNASTSGSQYFTQLNEPSQIAATWKISSASIPTRPWIERLNMGVTWPPVSSFRNVLVSTHSGVR